MNIIIEEVVMEWIAMALVVGFALGLFAGELIDSRNGRAHWLKKGRHHVR